MRMTMRAPRRRLLDRDGAAVTLDRGPHHCEPETYLAASRVWSSSSRVKRSNTRARSSARCRGRRRRPRARRCRRSVCSVTSDRETLRDDTRRRRGCAPTWAEVSRRPSTGPADTPRWCRRGSLVRRAPSLRTPLRRGRPRPASLNAVVALPPSSRASSTRSATAPEALRPRRAPAARRRRPIVPVAVAQRDLELRADRRDPGCAARATRPTRTAAAVRRGPEPVEHLVHRDREPGDLVVGLGTGTRR